MLIAFDFLAGLSLAFLLLSAASAYVLDPHFHALCGLATGLCVLAMHTLMFLFFIGTARAVKEAVRRRGLDPELEREDRRLMARVIAAGSLGPLTIVVASFLGASQTAIIRFGIHPGLMAIAAATNAWAYRRERAVIRAKHVHLSRARDLLSQIERGAVEPVTPPEAPPPAAFVLGAIGLLAGLTAAAYPLYRRFVMGDARAASAPWLLVGGSLVAAGAVAMRLGRSR